MAWREHLLPGSFRGARFLIHGHKAVAGGRRAQVHEYPGRDAPYAEDLGLVTGEFEVDAYVLEPDYMRARDALIRACRRAGAGRLVHPYLGTRNALCTGCTPSESTEEGGMARFRLSFVDAGENRFPQALLDTVALVAVASAFANSALVRQFTKRFGL